MVIDFIFVTRWEKEKSKYTMVTKTIPSKPKPEAKEVDFSNEDTTLTP